LPSRLLESDHKICNWIQDIEQDRLPPIFILAKFNFYSVALARSQKYFYLGKLQSRIFAHSKFSDKNSDCLTSATLAQANLAFLGNEKARQH
jgi:hypothetical protein